MNRRQFTQSLGSTAILTLTFGSILPLTGCSLISNISTYVGIGLQAFQAILSILSGAGVIPPGTSVAINLIIVAVKAAFADVSRAIADYENAPAADKTTLLGKISTALSAVVAELQNFWNDLNIPDSSLASLIEGLLGVIISTLQGFIGQLPTSATPPRASAAAKQVSAPPQKRSAKQFRADFNKLLVAGGHPEAQI